MGWHFDDDKPVYNQIVNKILTDVVTGVYKPNDRLPSVREFALDAGVNPNTMQKSLVALESTGVVFARTTSGRFVTDNVELIEKTRKELMEKDIRTFIERSEKYGMSRQQAADVVLNFKK